MAWGSANTLGSISSKSNGTSLALAASAQVEVGNVIVVAIAFDNTITTGVAAETTVISVADDSSNTYTRAKEYQFPRSSNAAAGAGSALFYAKVTTQLSNGANITITHPSLDARAFSAWEFTVASGATLSVAGSATQGDNAVDPSAISISSLTSSEYLWIHSLAVEFADTDTYTWDSDYTQFGHVGTSGGSGGSNMSTRGGFRIFTGTSDTVDVAVNTARTYAQVYAAILETIPVPYPQAFQVPNNRLIRQLLAQ